MPTTAPAPTPERIWSTLTAYQTSAALAAAIELDLYSHLAGAPRTIAALASATGASERGLRALANHLVAHELLVKEGDLYRATMDTAVFLDRRSQAYLGSIAGFLNSPQLVACFADLAGAVRRGGTLDEGGGTTSVENPVWVDFARAMQPLARALAGPVADLACRRGVPKRVLDVAASHGLYGIEVARRSPQTEVVFQDWRNVLELARENAERAELGRRARYLAGSAFDVDLGRGHDLVLVTNFLHHFDRNSCVRFLTRARQALAERGELAVLEFVLEESRVEPPGSAGFDLVMVATTPRGQAYTAGEYAGMFADAGLTAPERHDLPNGTHALYLAQARVR